MRILGVALCVFSFATASLAGDRGNVKDYRFAFYQGKGSMVTYADGSSKDYLVSTMCRRRGADTLEVSTKLIFDEKIIDNELVIQRKQGNLLKVSVPSNDGENPYRHVGWGYSYNLHDFSNMVLHFYMGGHHKGHRGHHKAAVTLAYAEHVQDDGRVMVHIDGQIWSKAHGHKKPVHSWSDKMHMLFVVR